VSSDDIGLIVCGLVLLGSAYEFVALLSPRVPTISRLVQGWRDKGGKWQVVAITVFCITALGVFGAWLWKHFIFEKRSNL
jgi:hypothetical protein